MRISLEVSEGDIASIAHCLKGHPKDARDIAARDDVLTRFVTQAAMMHSLNTPDIAAVTARDYAEFAISRTAMRDLMLGLRRMRHRRD